MDTNILQHIDNIYTLVAFLIFATVYLITFIYQRKHNNKQNQLLIDKSTENNERIVRKLEELREQRNTLDLQSSMDIISVIFNKSMLKISDGIRMIYKNYNMLDETRKELIYSKVKSIVNTQYDEDTIILSRIYYKNVKLSHYVTEIDRFELITSLYTKVYSSKTEKDYEEILDYIKSKYTHAIQSAQLGLSM